MSNQLYLDCPSGISGDMAVAALLDLGADENVLRQALKSLPVSGYEVKISRVVKSGLDACDFNVILDKAHENHDHDMEYLHGHDHHHDHGHHHDHHHHHEHRGLKEIMEIIRQGEMTDGAKALAVKIFQIIGQAEAKAHGVPADQVHFHEVGAVDSIVDIVAFAVCFDNLGITEVVLPRLNEGTGTVRCQHGILPVPVPAVANIVSDCQLPLHIMDVAGEFVTPTGAAIAAAIFTSTKLPETFYIKKIGLGAGKRHYERPSLLRAMLIGTPEDKQDCIYKLETDIDDCSGETLGFVSELLFEAGARDVHFMPVYMKKNRPAYELCVICTPEAVETMEQIIFENTTTIGIRKIPVERTILPRLVKNVQTPFGEAMVKVCELNGQQRFYPEYESVTALCRQHHMSYSQMYACIMEACR
mgnify:CR=1 FL=1